LSCSSDIVEEEIYKEYWMGSLNWRKENTWLNSYIKQDGCAYRNKSERWV
jgi:hypothetical protein